MNNAVFGKTTEKVRKHRYIKLVTTERRRNWLVSEPKYHTTKFFMESLLAVEMKKTNKQKKQKENKQTIEIRMNKPVFLGLSILELSRILLHEF